MPGRLGDDPLSRKRSTSNEKDAPSAQPGFYAQPTSHNDVFFRRRTEDPQQIPEGPHDREPGLEEAASTDEKPEISEVADIVRTAKVAEITQGAEQLTRPVPMDEPVHTPTEEPAEKTEQTPPTVSESAASFEPPPPVTEERASPDSSQPEQQPQKNEGFLKRLFGRFGK